MTYEALIEEIKTLPEPQLAEVSDFVFSLKQRSESDFQGISKFKTPQDYEQAQKLWAEFETLSSPGYESSSYDYKTEKNELRWKKYENLN